MTYLPPGAAGTTEMPAGDTGRPDEILLAFRGPASQNRLTVLVRIILAIPQLIAVWALSIAAEVVVIVCWFAALVLGLAAGRSGRFPGRLPPLAGPGAGIPPAAHRRLSAIRAW